MQYYMDYAPFAIKMTGVTKEYRLGQFGKGTLTKDIQSWWAKKRGKDDPNVKLENVGRMIGKDRFMALNGIDLEIKHGETVGLIGANGAGKSTLLKLLIRLYDVSDGAVLINGKDIRDYDVHALRMKIGVAFQDVRILAMSLRDTLTVYGDAPDEALVRAMETLGLGSVLERVGGDLGTMISREFTENGVVLSGGEAQRLALARLLAGNFGLLILDEPSAALDPLAEAKLMETIAEMAKNATTVMIAHRLSTVRDFDVIHYVEHGKIVESGSHDDLMARQGKYYKMFTTQAKKYYSSEA